MGLPYSYHQCNIVYDVPSKRELLEINLNDNSTIEKNHLKKDTHKRKLIDKDFEEYIQKKKGKKFSQFIHWDPFNKFSVCFHRIGFEDTLKCFMGQNDFFKAKLQLGIIIILIFVFTIFFTTLVRFFILKRKIKRPKKKQ